VKVGRKCGLTGEEKEKCEKIDEDADEYGRNSLDE
jgi:hypothetical protein